MKCLIVDDEEMSRATIEHFVSQTDTLKLVEKCNNAIDAGNVLRSTEIDLLFLDVEMPEMSGMDLIKSLVNPPQIILVTSKKGYAAEAFEHSVIDYLVKPVEYSRFLKAVNKAKAQSGEKMIEGAESKDFFVKSDNKIVKISYDDILFIEALADYAVINLVDAKHIIHSTMKALEAKLPTSDFMRVHRSYIVNLQKIASIEDMNIKLDSHNIPVGASYKDRFMQKINMF